MSYKSKPNLNTGTGSSTNSNGSSSSTNKYDYEEKEFFLKGSVVLCQHGFLGEGILEKILEGNDFKPKEKSELSSLLQLKKKLKD